MKKGIIFFGILVLGLSSLNAQDKQFQFGIGPALSVPTGFLQFSQGLGFGAELTALYSITENIKITGQTGYHSFSGKEFLGSKSPTATFIPIILGLRYSSKGLIVGLGIGYGMYDFGEGDKESGFSFRPQIGYDLGKIEIL